jgi:hypothetical protein
MTPGSWNPHWLAFARSLGRPPEELGCGYNVEFLCWIPARLVEFRRATGAGERLSDGELAEFGRYLFRWADEHGPAGQMALFVEDAA